MTAAFLSAAGITAIAFFFFVIEGESLAAAHARVRTQVLNAGRWGLVMACSWILIPVALGGPPDERLPTIVGMATFTGAIMLAPLRWLIRIGGRERNWELRRVKLEATRLANQVRRDPRSVPEARIRDTIERVRALRTPDLGELCDLMVAELEDLLAGAESWNEAGRRAVRIDELSRSFWPDDVPPPDYDPDEATFRWQLYRTFGQLMEVGVLDISPQSREEFQVLLASMNDFRRPDTDAFIESVQSSAKRWLAKAPARKPWIDSFDFQALGPDGLSEVRRIWGRDASMWGARLEESDRAAIDTDLTRRAATD
jgi:hypothetical protein